MHKDYVVRLPSTPLCLSSHETQAVLALGLVEGGIVVARVEGLFSSGSETHSGKNGSTLAFTKATHHVSSTCLTTAFQKGSSAAFFAGVEGVVHLFDIERSKPFHSFYLPPACNKNDTDAQQKEGRTPSTIYSYDPHTVLVGDDDGGIHMYDTRIASNSGAGRRVTGTLDQGDYISSLQRVDKYGTCAVLATSGDGTLCAYDVRHLPSARIKLEYAFDKFDDDILSFGIVECSDGQSIGVAGTLCGMLNLYNMNFLDVDADPSVVAHVDRFAGHPECVNSILTCAAKDIAVTASSDGFVRVVDVVSKTLLGVLDYSDKADSRDETKGERENNDSLADVKLRKRRRKKQPSRWPIEGMVHVHGASTPALALICHDELVRFCDARPLTDDDELDAEQCQNEDESKPHTESVGENGEGSTPGTESKASLSLPSEAAFPRKNKKGKKKRSENAGENIKSAGFFDDL